MVELLIVIVIIGLVLGISLTVISKARSSGREKVAEAQLNAIDSALNSYRQDFSRWPSSHVSYPGMYEFPGAVLLVETLLGPEGKGLKKAGSNKTYGPYLNAKSNQLHQIDEGGGDSTDDGSDIDQYTADEPKYVFMDPFGRHVLYYKARLSESGVGNIYRRGDNWGGSNQWLLTFEDKKYKLTHEDPNSDSKISDQIWDAPGFRRFIYDPPTTDSMPNSDDEGTPYNNNTYLLMMAGPDKRFGTADDICNFKFDKDKNLDPDYQ